MSAFGFSYIIDSYGFRMDDFQGHPLYPSRVNKRLGPYLYIVISPNDN